MDADVWRNLPHELTPLILAHLPWWSNLQLRAVCKAWRAQLSDPRSIASTSGTLVAASPHSVYGILSPGIVSTAGSSAAVNIVGKHYWNALPRPSSLPDFPWSDFFELQAASEGLLLMEGRLIERGRVLINPMNKTFRRVPPVPGLTGGFCSEGFAGRGLVKEHVQDMVVGGRDRNVRIVALQHQPIDGHVVPTTPRSQSLMTDLELWRIHVYDMGRDAWELVSCLQSEHLQRIKNVTLVGKSLYLLTKQPSSRHRHRHRVFKVVAEELLVEVPADITIDIPTVHLFQHRERVMLVSGAGQKQSGLDVWRLDEIGGRWEKVVSIPESLVGCGRGRRDFQVDAEGDLLLLTSEYKKNVILTVDLVEGTWMPVSCKTELFCQDWATLRAFLWHPRLDIVL